MNLYEKWMNLPFKARMYIGTSTLLVAFIGDYVISSIGEEVEEREKLAQQHSSNVNTKR